MITEIVKRKNDIVELNNILKSDLEEVDTILAMNTGNEDILYTLKEMKNGLYVWISIDHIEYCTKGEYSTRFEAVDSLLNDEEFRVFAFQKKSEVFEWLKEEYK